ncbi:hypothetical protein THAOC_28307 [Thalassiosira oceanica]|uniref:Uncharacterized protein n=1 Tax=Thalassiosira oceanica TaxID=159749 RepID=K0RU55_THAOC|nr:hypothetical protein THAOC_28307 [Thalassiosira oceanica]|eukprot:EJK52416.1 hypothetical protein THAOC_28307 [Thalassiosira oceanica]
MEPRHDNLNQNVVKRRAQLKEQSRRSEAKRLAALHRRRTLAAQRRDAVKHNMGVDASVGDNGSGNEVMSDASVVDNASPLGIRGGADDGDPSEVGGQQQASSRLPPHVQLNNAGSTATVRTAAGDSQLEEKLKDLIRR